MKKSILLFAALFYSLICFSQLNLSDIISQSEKAVCLIESFNSNGEIIKIGTGFFIDENGTCVSNYHVLENSSIVKITTIDGKKYTLKEIIKSSIYYDLIVFKEVKFDGI